tara:strand:+ start:240 stop:842 length:603 start_codon:yes stop_codon:yes gene_type:complete
MFYNDLKDVGCIDMVLKYIKWLCIMITSLFLGTSSLANEKSAYVFEFESIDGKKISLSEYKGNVILIVNTASECGFTQQYAGLQTLWEKYRKNGLIVLGIPSNDFGGQEPGTNGQIKNFCKTNFNIDFPMTAKTVVKGRNAHPFYRWVGNELGWMAGPKWNFHKYLITREGTLHSSYSSVVGASSSSLQEQIISLLAQPS